MLATETIERLLTEVDEIGSLTSQLRQRLSAIYVLLDQAMHEAHPPKCPKCGSAMVIRHQKKNPESRFLGCIKWRPGSSSHCKGSMGLDEWRRAAETAVREQVKA